MTGPARVAVLGPGHPFRGGIVDHTVELVRRLHSDGLLSEHAAWSAPFPLRLHPDGRDVRRRDVGPERPAVRPTSDLRWWDPPGWVRVGRRLGRDAELLLLVVWSPLQLPAVAAVARSFRAASRESRGGDRPVRRRVHLIVHNVLPHERSRPDVPLMRRLLPTADAVVVHTAAEAALARRLGAREPRVAALPLHAPDGMVKGAHPAGARRLDALALFGFIRPYKGLEDLIRALALTRSRPRLIVHGRFWEPVERSVRLAAAAGLADRVELRDGYASPDELTSLLAAVDAVVLPYRSGTGSQQPRIAALRGVPVIVSDVGDLARQVRDGIDGIVVPVGTAGSAAESRVAALAASIDAFYTGDRWLRLRSGVRAPDPDAEWAAYLSEVVRD